MEIGIDSGKNSKDQYMEVYTLNPENNKNRSHTQQKVKINLQLLSYDKRTLI